jgi:hypothetical protein
LDDPYPHPPGTPTPAGWSFVREAPLASVAVPAGAVVEIEVDTTRFRVDGQIMSPATVAKLIAEVQRAEVESMAQPVVLLTGESAQRRRGIYFRRPCGPARPSGHRSRRRGAGESPRHPARRGSSGAGGHGAPIRRITRPALAIGSWAPQCRRLADPASVLLSAHAGPPAPLSRPAITLAAPGTGATSRIRSTARSVPRAASVRLTESAAQSESRPLRAENLDL